jgi:hypothetical protein
VLRYNSPNCPVKHRTVSGVTPDCPVCHRSNGYFARNGRLQRIKCALARVEDRGRAVGAPDSLQDLSGAPPDSPKAPQVRAPTVEPQRLADVAGAPDSVRWGTGLSGAPYDSSIQFQTLKRDQILSQVQRQLQSIVTSERVIFVFI